MTRRVASGAVPELRAARIAALEDLAEGRPTMLAALGDKLAALRNGEPFVVDSAAMFSAVHRIAPNVAVQKYAYRTDRDNRRRFLIDANDVVTELPAEERR